MVEGGWGVGVGVRRKEIAFDLVLSEALQCVSAQNVCVCVCVLYEVTLNSGWPSILKSAL